MPAPLHSIERILVGFATPFWQAVYRIGLGFAVLPAFAIVGGDHSSSYGLWLFFIAILLVVRLAPAVFRHVLPFSAPVQGFWRQQRQLAKRYDSYQWRKLFWIGIGLTIYLSIWPRMTHLHGAVALAAVSLASGGAGLVVWRTRARTDAYLGALKLR